MPDRTPTLEVVTSLPHEALLERKRQGGSTISVCLPAHNEESTIAHIVGTIRRELVEATPLVDELIVLDDASTDATALAARDEGATVVAVAEVLVDHGVGSGKGNALWKSLHVCSGDLIVWVDADIRNFAPHFVTELVRPLLTDRDVSFAKGYYRRPLHGEPGGGGRVTELVARPLLSHFFPKLADVIQPLAGEYAGRRELLEAIPFAQGWGVEFGLLVDVMERVGRAGLAQVDLGVREHRNRPLDQLGSPAMGILVTALRRAGVESIDDDVAALIRFDGDHRRIEELVEVRERPPMLSIPEYRRRSHG